MDQYVKNQMMEFIEPGSSIPLERLLDEFAKLANSTNRASFHITKNVRTKKWRLHLSAAKKSFVGDDLRKLVIEAGEFIYTNTCQKEDVRVLKLK